MTQAALVPLLGETASQLQPTRATVPEDPSSGPSIRIKQLHWQLHLHAREGSRTLSLELQQVVSHLMWVPGWSSSPLQEWEALALHRWVVSVALVITKSDSIFDKFRSLRFILPII